MFQIVDLLKTRDFQVRLFWFIYPGLQCNQNKM